MDNRCLTIMDFSLLSLSLHPYMFEFERRLHTELVLNKSVTHATTMRCYVCDIENPSFWIRLEYKKCLLMMLNGLDVKAS